MIQSTRKIACRKSHFTAGFRFAFAVLIFIASSLLTSTVSSPSQPWLASSAYADSDLNTSTQQPEPTAPATTASPFTTPTTTSDTTVTLQDDTNSNPNSHPTQNEDKPQTSTQTLDLPGGVEPRQSNSPFDPLSSNATLQLGPLSIGKFDIPPLAYLPIYEAAAAECGVDKYVLIGIHKIETNFSQNLSRSSAGAEGPMQFMPATWETHGMDADGNGKKDIQNPIDAIFAAACYLKEAGYAEDPGKAIFAYNHADWYVKDIQQQATYYAQYAPIIDSLTSMTQSFFPVAGKTHYQGDISSFKKSKQAAAGTTKSYVAVQAATGAPVIATQDGRITDVTSNSVTLQDVYGNKHIYTNLGSTTENVPAPRQTKNVEAADANHSEGETTTSHQADKKHVPHKPSKSSTKRLKEKQHRSTRKYTRKKAELNRLLHRSEPSFANSPRAKERLYAEPQPQNLIKPGVPRNQKERLYANPTRAGAVQAGGQEHLQSDEISIPSGVPIDKYITEARGIKRNDLTLHRLRPGITVYAGTILGHASTSRNSPVHFSMQPLGGPKINPAPILNNIAALQQTGFEKVWRQQLRNSKLDGKLTPGQALLMSKPALQSYVLRNANIKIYSGGRHDIRQGIVDRRILATLAFLETSGYKLRITSLVSGHSFYTASGNVSAHPFGCAVDIAAVNGTPILGHQGAGSITDEVVRKLLTLQGTYKPDQIITLMKYDGTDNTLALSDHDDHIHVGCRVNIPGQPGAKQFKSALTKQQWQQLIHKLQKIKPPHTKDSSSTGGTVENSDQTSSDQERPVLDIAKNGVTGNQP